MPTIDEILSANSWGFFGMPKTKESLRFLQFNFHPDKNLDPRAHEAFVKINDLFNGPDFDTRVASGIGNDHKITWTPKKAFSDRLDVVNKRFSALSRLEDQFKMFFPKFVSSSLDSITLEYGEGWWYLDSFDELDSRTLVWIAKRLAGALNQSNNLGFAHANINPKTVLIMPTEHGLKIDGWWHSVQHGDRLVLKPDTKTPPKYFGGFPVENKIDIAQSAEMLQSIGKPDKLVAEVLKKHSVNPGTPVEFFNEIDDVARKLYGKNTWHPLGLPTTQMI